MQHGYEKTLFFCTSSTNLRKYSLKIPKLVTGLLWTLEIPVNDLVLVEVVHPCGDLFGPLHQLLWRHVLAYTQTGSRVQRSAHPEMEFLDTNLTKDSSLCLHAIHSPFYWILKKPYTSLVLKKTSKKIRKENKTLVQS
jgi:hypothetical protein